MRKRVSILPSILALCLFAQSANGASGKKDFILMDTFVRIEIRDELQESRKEEAINKAFKRMEELSGKFDYFKKESELAKINGLKKGETLTVSDDMLSILGFSRKMHDETNGAFDVTVLSSRGPSIWAVNAEEKTISFNEDGVKIDLSGVAKGYIVDEGVKSLRQSGIKKAIVNAGGDMYCAGKARIGIRDPRDKEKIIGFFDAENTGIATSGAYERPGHIIDPRTGSRVKERLKSVTVTAKNCQKADALATALFVTDIEKGLSLIESTNDAECVIIDEKGALHVSSGMPQITLTNEKR